MASDQVRDIFIMLENGSVGIIKIKTVGLYFFLAIYRNKTQKGNKKRILHSLKDIPQMYQIL